MDEICGIVGKIFDTAVLKKYKLMKGKLPEDISFSYKTQVISFYKSLFEKYCTDGICIDYCGPKTCIEDTDTYEYKICPDGTLLFNPIDCILQNIIGFDTIPCYSSFLDFVTQGCIKPDITVTTKPCYSSDITIDYKECPKPGVSLTTKACYSASVNGIIYNLYHN